MQRKEKNRSGVLPYLILHLIFGFYSFGGVCCKEAAQHPFLSMPFCLFYGCTLLLLMVYAVAWQQIIKKMPLTLAFSQKGVTVLWGMLWGKVFFQENITVGKVVGAILVIAGIVLFTVSGEKK